MAVTSIWSVKGQLGKVVAYVENPEKTMNPRSTDGDADKDKEKDREKTGKDKNADKETQAAAPGGGQGLSDVIAYAVNEEKTRRKKTAGEKAGEKGRKTGREDEIADEGEALMEQYVSGINCAPATARMEMAAVKKKYGKEDGAVAFHGYQSFAPGECTPAMAHEIGVRLAEELWGKRFQVLVATHLDKAHHLHNHFVVNSVSFADGLKYHRTKQDYREMRKASDRLCREHGLSVVEKSPGRGKSYGEWKAGQEGKPTYKGLVREDVEDAIKKSRTEKQFYQLLREKGYSLKIGKDITVRPEGRERGLKLARNFGEEYSIEAIRRRILLQAEERGGRGESAGRGRIGTGAGAGIGIGIGIGTGLQGSAADCPVQESSKSNEFKGTPGNSRTWETAALVYRGLPLPGKKLSGKKITGKKRYDVRAYGARCRVRKLKGLRGMYFRYCYLLGILPEDGKRRSPGQVHHLFREDLIKMDTIAKETRLLCHYRIDTKEQLFSLQEDLKAQMEELVGRRKTLRTQSRSIRDKEKISLVKAEVKELTEQIGTVRKEIKLCAGIAARSGKIKERMEIKEMIQQKKIREKEADSHEHIRGCR